MSRKGFRKVIMPSRYVQGAGAIDEIGSFVSKLGKRPFVVAGKTSFGKVGVRVEDSLDSAETPLVGFVNSVGECTYEGIDSAVKESSRARADVIIGCGGGKAVDTAKAVADKQGLPVVTVPTQCATNADQMADAVIFTADHQFVEDYYLSRAPALVLVDTEVVGFAPVEYLVQGMGDALASGFEKPAYASTMLKNESDSLATSAAVEVNLRCFSVLMAHGVQAKSDSQDGTMSDSLESIIEAIKLMSGFGFGGGGCAAAHAIHNGLISVPGVARKHGEIVAFGTLSQMMLERRSSLEVERVMRWCGTLGLPTCLDELGDLDRSRLREAAEKACDPEDTMQNMPFEVTPEMVLDAINMVDDVSRSLD
ncbi:MAG: glycerol dehydrogenase [Methanobacteriota archaeon]|nr:MAG: glycerol dehydrogenase [Euryarchaeota archaeon]